MERTKPTDFQSRRVRRGAKYSHLAGKEAATVYSASLAIAKEVQILGPSSLFAFETPSQVLIFQESQEPTKLMANWIVQHRTQCNESPWIHSGK